MLVVDIANEIYVDAGSPTTTSIAAIAFWIRGKVGELNNLLMTGFIINSSYEIVDGDGTEIPIEAVSVIKKMYKIYDYEVQIRTHMNAVLTDTVLEVSDQGSSVKRINRNEVSKTFANLKGMEETALKNLVHAFKNRAGGPSQVAGDDTMPGFYSSSTYPNYRSIN